MGGFDDELRAVLRERASRVTPHAGQASAVERRARRVRRQRLATAGAGALLAVGAVVTAMPYALTRDGADPERKPARIAAALPKPGPPLTPLSSRQPPSLPGAPGNQLHWPSRGYQPPEPFRAATATWYVRHVPDGAGKGADAGKDAGTARPRRHLLWSGPLPDSRWAALEQYWTPHGLRRWRTVLFVGGEDGRGLHAAYRSVTTFNHQRPRESASLSTNQVDRVAGYGFGFADFVLVVGSPRAEQASITLNGRTVRKLTMVDGAALFEPVHRGRVELFQLRDRHGRLLTPNDDRAATYGSRGAAIQGWVLDRR